MVTDERVLVEGGGGSQRRAPDTGWRRADGRTRVLCVVVPDPQPHRRPARSESRFSIEGPVDTQTTTNNAATARRTHTHVHTRTRPHANEHPRATVSRHRRVHLYRRVYTHTHGRAAHARSLYKPFACWYRCCNYYYRQHGRPDITYTRARRRRRRRSERARADGRGGERKCSHA